MAVIHRNQHFVYAANQDDHYCSQFGREETLRAIFCLGIAFYLTILSFLNAGEQSGTRRNVIVFVADGLRAGSVNASDTPTLSSIREQGVHFANSHSLFPTFTMANASAIATGHGLGDTGIFGNVLWVRYPTYNGSPVPFLENDQMLKDVAGHFGWNFPSETTLLAAAARQGYNVAAVGKVGPTGVLNMGTPLSVIVDDATGNTSDFPLSEILIKEIRRMGLPSDAPSRNNGYGPTSPWNNGYAGTMKQAGTRYANVVQQQWFNDVATRVILPAFQQELPKPFLLMYWSRDPDGSQHNQGDSLGSLVPGINGETSKLGVANADRSLKQILNWLDSNPAIKANTDVFVTADHGFATISKREISQGLFTTSEAAKYEYVDASGNKDTERGFLPYGFLAIDLALGMHTNLFDPDRRSGQEGFPYRQVRLGPDIFERPALGNGLIGREVKKGDGSDARAIVASNGGANLIYVPGQDHDTVEQIVRLLASFDYVGGIFVDDQHGSIAGALPLSAIGLVGSSAIPRPSIVVALKVFYLSAGNLQTAVQISDATQQQGQGMHGGLGRESTFNNMAAFGPDFKTRFVDRAPVSNADIAPTIAHILGIDFPSIGKLKGRVIFEAIRGNTTQPVATSSQLESAVAAGRRTILHFQQLDGIRYLDRGCFVESNKTCP